MDNTDTSDDDQSLLDQVLNNLYDFGDAMASETKKKKKSKRKRREEEVEDEEVVSDDTQDTQTQHPPVKHSQGTPVPVHPHPPRVQRADVEVVTFEDPAKKPRVQQKPASDFKIARLEVHRFGIRGYKKEQQRSFEQERAIMLGAKPPKKQYLNYKTLQQDLQEKKKKAKEEVQPDQKKKKNSKPGDKKKKKKKGTTTPSVFGSSTGSASMGRFKGGMLMLSSKEIEKINGPS
ncbi:unnamed protein product [Merluccius merluccius]